MNMEKLNYSITIDAPKEKVWNTMLEKNTYTDWTSAFAEGSTYKGDWR
jgi:ligand-binding SRPBCC domain-containing protein